MGVGVVVMSLLGKVESNVMFCLFGTGLACLALIHIAYTDGEGL